MPDDDPKTATKPAKPDRPWWKRKRWWIVSLLVLLVAALVWLNGPGWRVVGETAGRKYLSDQGLEGDFELKGNLTGGEIGVENVDLKGEGMIESVEIDELNIRYNPREVVKRKIEGIDLKGADFKIDLAKAVEQPEEDKQPFAPEDLPALLTKLHQQLGPIEINAEDVAATIRNGDELVFSIESSSIRHQPGSPVYELDLGAIELPGGRRLEPQSVTLNWTEDSLTIERLDVMPGVMVQNLSARYPDEQTLRFSAEVVVSGTILTLETDLEEATVAMSGEPLTLAEIGAILAMELPGEATVRSLEINATGIRGGLGSIDGTAELGLTDVAYGDWTSPRLGVGARLQGDKLGLALNGEALGSPLDLVSATTVSREDGFVPLSSDIELSVAELHEPLTAVRDRYIGTTRQVEVERGDAGEIDDTLEVVDPEAEDKPDEIVQIIENPDGEPVDERPPADPPPEPDRGDDGDDGQTVTKTVRLPDIPESSLTGTASLSFDGWTPSEAHTDLSITSPTDAPPISLDGSWTGGSTVAAMLEFTGIDLNATYEIEGRQYSGDLAVDDFAPGTLERWLQPFGIDPPTGMRASLTWKGGGDLKAGTHRGEFDISSFEWDRPDEFGPIKMFASGSYDWPRMADLPNINVQQDAQKIEGSLHLENQLLEVGSLAWSDGDDVLLTASGEIPVGEDPTDWKAMLRSERELTLDIQSTRLPLTKLHPFLPEDIRFPDDSTAHLAVQLSGSAADPVLDASLDVSDLQLLAQEKVPPTDITLEAVGRDQTLKLEGSANAAGYPPARVTAITNWSPEQWAEDPDTLRQAKLDASLNVSDLNLELFSEYLPDARRIEGVIDINAEVTGTIGEPEPLGTVTLRGGRFESTNDEIPRLKDGEVTIIATPERINIEQFSGRISGGTLTASGGLDLTDGQPQTIDVRLNGRALPVKRDDSMIIRLNLDLSVTGRWETATIAGSINVIDSLFFKDIEILPIGVPFNQPSEPELPSVHVRRPSDFTADVPEPFRDWRLSLNLGSINPFLIRGNLANGEVVLDAQVGGTIANPRPTGSATLRGGEAELPFSTLEVDEGRLVFRPNQPFDPLLELRGESTVRPYLIDVYVYGPISDPTVLPTSNPPLPESEIMTLLATGTTTEGLEDPGAATARAAQLLIEELRRGRIKNVEWMQPVLSVLEDVDFQVGAQDPYTSAKYNSATISLNDNLLLRAGLSDDGNTRTSLTYLLRFR